MFACARPYWVAEGWHLLRPVWLAVIVCYCRFVCACDNCLKYFNLCVIFVQVKVTSALPCCYYSATFQWLLTLLNDVLVELLSSGRHVDSVWLFLCNMHTKIYVAEQFPFDFCQHKQLVYYLGLSLSCKLA